MTAIESQLNSFLKVAEGTLEMNIVIAQFDDLPSQVLHLLHALHVKYRLACFHFRAPATTDGELTSAAATTSA